MHQVKLVDYFFLLHLPGLNQAQTYVLACLRTSLMIMFNADHDQTLFEDLSDDHVAHPFKGHTRAHLSQLGLALSWPSFNP